MSSGSSAAEESFERIATLSAKPRVQSAIDIMDSALSVEERIRQRAYNLYVERSCQDGSDLDDWLQAELEIREPLKRTAYRIVTDRYTDHVRQLYQHGIRERGSAEVRGSLFESSKERQVPPIPKPQMKHPPRYALSDLVEEFAKLVVRNWHYEAINHVRAIGEFGGPIEAKMLVAQLQENGAPENFMIALIGALATIGGPYVVRAMGQFAPIARESLHPAIVAAIEDLCLSDLAISKSEYNTTDREVLDIAFETLTRIEKTTASAIVKKHCVDALGQVNWHFRRISDG